MPDKKNQRREDPLHSQLRFFKGLSFVMLIVVMIVFLTFGSLFALMYNQFVSMGVSLEKSYEKMASAYDKLNMLDSSLFAEVEDLYFNGTTDVELDTSAWPIFEHNEFSLLYPPEWSYVDNLKTANQARADFFVDGQKRQALAAGEIGDFYITLDPADNYQANHEPVELYIGGQKAVSYIITDESTAEKLILLPRGSGYITLHFRFIQNNQEMIPEEYMSAIQLGVMLGG